MSDKQNTIELRSEKIRGVIGRIPSILIRIGIGIISITVLCALLLLFFLPYPTYIEEKIHIYSEPNYFIKRELANGIIQYDSIEYVKKGEEIYRIIQNFDTIVAKSPIEGNIVFFCANNINIQKGTAICKITPSEVQYIFGIMYIPHYKLDHINKGKRVEVFIDSQKINGFIDRIYPTNQYDDLQCIRVILDVGYNKSDFVKQMTSTGQVRILVSNKPFLKRILNL